MEETNIMLGKAGVILFTIGLILGAAIPKFRNPRMGLSAHLTAVQAGTALIAFALFWRHLEIAAWASTALSLSLIFSTLLLTLGLTLAAIFGASRSLPIAGHGFRASATKETIVSLLAIGSSIWMLLALLAICISFLT